MQPRDPSCTQHIPTPRMYVVLVPMLGRLNHMHIRMRFGTYRGGVCFAIDAVVVRITCYAHVNVNRNPRTPFDSTRNVEIHEPEEWRVVRSRRISPGPRPYHMTTVSHSNRCARCSKHRRHNRRPSTASGGTASCSAICNDSTGFASATRHTKQTHFDTTTKPHIDIDAHSLPLAAARQTCTFDAGGMTGSAAAFGGRANDGER